MFATTSDVRDWLPAQETLDFFGVTVVREDGKAVVQCCSGNPHIIRGNGTSFASQVPIDRGIVLSSDLVRQEQNHAIGCDELLQFRVILRFTWAHGKAREQFPQPDAAQGQTRGPPDNVDGFDCPRLNAA
ncbi:MAG: hypothetical protein M5U01_23740 [Ardenticatenaceae bacterium]|nr:hypothetical protein [Ardenticatenaceae bacterium]